MSQTDQENNELIHEYEQNKEKLIKMINNNESPLIIQAVQARQEELEELLQIKDDSGSNLSVRIPFGFEDLSDSEDFESRRSCTITFLYNPCQKRSI